MTREQAEELIRKEFPSELLNGAPLVEVSIIEGDKVVFIAGHRSLGDHIFTHAYYLLAVDKWLFNKVVYSDTNVVCGEAYKTAEETKERTINYLRHLLTKI